MMSQLIMGGLGQAQPKAKWLDKVLDKLGTHGSGLHVGNENENK